MKIIRLARYVLLLQLLVVGPESVMAANLTYKRTLEQYQVPDLVLVNQDGKRLRFGEMFQGDKPVIVDFIFGTCTTICPVLSAGYANLQQKLPAQQEKVHLVSISIDPENDTPKVLKEYLRRYRAKPGWDFFTGSRTDINAVMRAMDSYIPNKMSHYPLTLIWVPKDRSWIRINGLMSSSEFLDECRKAGIKL
jgi:protein SCO1/2